jgi:hypothetical protein
MLLEVRALTTGHVARRVAGGASWKGRGRRAGVHAGTSRPMRWRANLKACPHGRFVLTTDLANELCREVNRHIDRPDIIADLVFPAKRSGIDAFRPCVIAGKTAAMEAGVRYRSRARPKPRNSLPGGRIRCSPAPLCQRRVQQSGASKESTLRIAPNHHIALAAARQSESNRARNSCQLISVCMLKVLPEERLRPVFPESPTLFCAVPLRPEF